MTGSILPAELAVDALNSLPERICVLDYRGSIVFTNYAWRLAIQDAFPPVHGRVGDDYLPLCTAGLSPGWQGVSNVPQGIKAVLHGGSSQFTLEYAWSAASGKRWFRLAVRPLATSSGAMVIHSEITRQVVLADKLRRSRIYAEDVLANPNEAFTWLASGGIIREQNPASEAVFGMSPQELVGRQVFDFVHPLDLASVRKLFRACLCRAPSASPCEYRFRCKDGSWRMVESTAILISEVDQTVVLHTRDVTPQKLREEASRAKQDALELDSHELRDLMTRVFRVQETQHRELASKLNYVSQRLASLALEGPAMARTDGAGANPLRDCLAGLARQLGSVSAALHPTLFDCLGLPAALRDHCEKHARVYDIPVHFVHRGMSLRLPPYTAVSVYRIAEDALENIAHHAHARQIWVTLSRTHKGIRLSVRDDGEGFDPAAVEPGAGFGLRTMRERVRGIQGSLSIEARKGGGTEMVALVPLPSVSNQTRAAIAGNVVVHPFDRVHQRYEQLHEPGHDSGRMHPPEVGYGAVAEDHH